MPARAQLELGDPGVQAAVIASQGQLQDLLDHALEPGSKHRLLLGALALVLARDALDRVDDVLRRPLLELVDLRLGVEADPLLQGLVVEHLQAFELHDLLEARLQMHRPRCLAAVDLLEGDHVLDGRHARLGVVGLLLHMQRQGQRLDRNSCHCAVRHSQIDEAEQQLRIARCGGSEVDQLERALPAKLASNEEPRVVVRVVDGRPLGKDNSPQELDTAALRVERELANGLEVGVEPLLVEVERDLVAWRFGPARGLCLLLLSNGRGPLCNLVTSGRH